MDLGCIIDGATVPCKRKRREISGWLFRTFLPIALLFACVQAVSQEQAPTGYEQTNIALKIPQIGVVDVPVFIHDNVLFLPVSSLFSFLKIQNTPSPSYDSISGYFIKKEATFLIDRTRNVIEYEGKTYRLQAGDLLRTETNLYMRSEYFGAIFGLECDFDYRALMATLNAKMELPIIRELKLEQMRNNLRKLKDEITADTVIPKEFSMFHFGNIDWAFATTEQTNGQTRFVGNLALGTILAGGEANMRLNYVSGRPMTNRQLTYYWHYANNEHNYFRQAVVGKISVPSTSTVYSPLIGVILTNTPTTYRRSFGTYTLSDYTEPGWIVELYVNNVLVDYKKADASGFFSFKVAMVYGNSSIMLRFYGPWGEERSRTQKIIIPFNFLPKGNLEYFVSAAMLENSRRGAFSRANVSYGLTHRLTLGGGAEYLSTIPGRNVIPFVNFSARIGSGLLLSGEYNYGVRLRGIMSCSLPLGMHLDFNYIYYDRQQKAVTSNFLEERRATLTWPFNKNKFSSVMRLSAEQVLLERSKNFHSELLVSATAFGINANITTAAMFNNSTNSYIYSTVALGLRLPAKLYLVPQIQYDYTHSRLISCRTELEKKLFANGLVKVSYEHNFVAGIWNVQAGLQYNFPFAQTGISSMTDRNSSTFAQMASGSVMFDAKSHWVGANNLPSVGKGGLTIKAFLDMNDNARWEKDEPGLTGLNVHLTGGRLERSNRDSCLRVYDLEPFTSYFIECDKSSFDNVSWQIRKPVINVTVDPNQFKLVLVPVAVMGEASGMVYKDGSTGLVGQGRVILLFYREDSTLVARIQTETDGYFSYMGLPPGKYYVKIDPAQISKLNITVSPPMVPFEILRSRDGDQAGGIDFVIRNLQDDSVRVTGAISPDSARTVPVSGESQGTPVVLKTPDTIPHTRPAPVPVPVYSPVPIPVTADSGRAPSPAKGNNEPPGKAHSRPATTAVPVTRSTTVPGSSGAGTATPVARAGTSQGKPGQAAFTRHDTMRQATQGQCGTAMQIGAFRIKANADRSWARLNSALNRTVDFVVEDNYYKVRIPGDPAELDTGKLMASLAKTGFSEIYLVRKNCIAIQVVAFRNMTAARSVQVTLAGKLNRTVSLVSEKGMYKVRVTGFSSVTEAQQFMDNIFYLGYREAYIVVP